MKKNLGAAPMMFPQPVLIIALSSHKTTDNIMKKGAFTVSMGDKDHVVACDYVGLVSANQAQTS